jgi:pilus assembly protein Flp/PilA
MNLIKRLIKDEEGQGLIEYALIVGLVALVAIVGLTAAGSSISDLFDKIKDKLDGVTV